MPGSPTPVFGSDAVTFGVACAAAFLAASAPYALRDRLPSPRRLAILGGLTSAGGAGVWAAARTATIGFGHIDVTAWFFAAFLLGLVVLAVQVAVPLYVYARWRLVSAVAFVFVATATVLYLFLRVGGESDPYFLYAMFFGPILLAGGGLVVVAEFGLRRLLGRALSGAA